MKPAVYNRMLAAGRPAGTSAMILACGLAILLLAAPVHAVGLARGNNAANDLVERGELDAALEKYNEVKIEHPDAPEVDYNAANVRFMKGQLDSAALEYKGAIASLTGPVAPNANYNLGNALYRMQEYGAAVEAYKQALRLNPNDQDAKFNLELALRQMQQDSSDQKSDQQQEQQEPDSTGQNQDQEQQQKNESDSTNQNQEQQQQDQQKKDSAQGQPPPQQQEAKDQEQQQGQTQPQQAGMTKEDAERLLDALRDQELEVQKRRLQKVATPAAVDKDW